MIKATRFATQVPQSLHGSFLLGTEHAFGALGGLPEWGGSGHVGGLGGLG